MLTSTGTLKTSIGTEARVGTVISAAPVELLDRAVASGSVTSASTVKLINGAPSNGKVENATLSLQKLLPLNVTFPASQGDKSLEHDVKLSLSPGSYGTLSVKSRAVLTLTPGDYYFNSLQVLEPDAAIVINRTDSSKPVRIYTKSALTFRGKVREMTGKTPNVLFVYAGTTPVPIESAFTGTLVAPSAKVTVNRTNQPHQGAFFAKDLDVQANTRVVHVPSQIQWQP